LSTYHCFSACLDHRLLTIPGFPLKLLFACDIDFACSTLLSNKHAAFGSTRLT